MTECLVLLVVVTRSCSQIDVSRYLPSIESAGASLLLVCNDPRHAAALDEYGQLRTLHTGRNLGGAGGYAAGLQFGVSRGFGWIGTLDDDGHAEDPSWLATLVQQAESARLDVIAALVVAADRPREAAFPFRFGLTRTWSLERINRHVLIPGQFHPFNGTLFSRGALLAVGSVDGRLTLEGDETDLHLRIRRAGLASATTTSVRVLHPSGRALMRPAVFGPFGVPLPRSRLKFAYRVRNRGYLVRVHRRYWWALIDAVRYPLAAIGRDGRSIERIRQVWSLYLSGARKQLNPVDAPSVAAWGEILGRGSAPISDPDSKQSGSSGAAHA